MDVAGDKKTVGISAEKTNRGAAMTFTELEGLDKTPSERFLGNGGKALLDALNAEIATHIGDQEMVLALLYGRGNHFLRNTLFRSGRKHCTRHGALYHCRNRLPQRPGFLQRLVAGNRFPRRNG